MSTPFPVENASLTERSAPVWDPWKGPASPHWYSGLGFNEETAYLGPLYRTLEAAGSGAAKGEALLTGAWHTQADWMASGAEKVGLPGADTLRKYEQSTAELQQDARDRVKAMTPDAATTGTAVQLIHGLGEGVYLATVGGLGGGVPAAAAFTGSAEGTSRYQELTEQGVRPLVAAGSAAVTGIAAGAGVMMPGGFGSSLVSKVFTGAAGNVGFGIANRYADHKILELGGYNDMAAQIQVMDNAQVLTDAVLGSAFGALAHLHSSAEKQTIAALKGDSLAEDAARTVETAQRNRQSATGIPADPAAAAAHHSALEKATEDLLQGKPADIASTGVDKENFIERRAPENATASELILHHLQEGGILDEEANLADLESVLSQKRGESAAKPTASKAQEYAGYTVGEEAMTDEQAQAFERSVAAQGENVSATVGRSGQASEGRLGNDGAGGTVGTAGETVRLYRGGRGGPLSAEHFQPDTLGKATGHPSSGLGVFFTSDATDAASYGSVTAHDVALKNPAHIPVEDLPGFDSLDEARAFSDNLRAKGHDGAVIDASHLGGPKHYVVFDHGSVGPAKRAKSVNVISVNPDELHFREGDQSRLDSVRNDFSSGEYPPITTIMEEDGSRTILDGHNRAAVAKERGDAIDAVQVTRAEYNALKKSNFDDIEISYAALRDADQSEAADRLVSQFPGADVYSEGNKAWDALIALREQKKFVQPTGSPVEQAKAFERPWHVDGIPVWEMSSEDLAKAEDGLRAQDAQILNEAFGNETDAKKFAKLADSNSDRAYEKAEEMKASLSPEKQQIIDRWERGEGMGSVTPMDLKELRNKVSDVEAAQSPQELVQVLKYAVTKLGNETDPEKMALDQLGAAMQIKEGLGVSIEHGWDTAAISRETIIASAQRFKDANDAEFMLRRFMKQFSSGPADPTMQALKDRPLLQIADATGTESAASAMQDADRSVSTTTDEAPKAVTAAINCFTRKGS